MGVPTAGIQALARSFLGQKVAKFTIGPGATVTVIDSPASGFFRMTGGGTISLISLMVSSGNPVYVNYTARLLGSFGSVVIQNNSVYGEYTADGIWESPIIGPGESITIENLDGSESLDVVATYGDFASPDLTLYRLPTNGTSLVTLVPAAPVGKVRIQAPVSPLPFYPGVGEGESVVQYGNRDDISHGYVIRNDSKLLANFPIGYVSPGDLGDAFVGPAGVVDSTGPLEASLQESTNSQEGLFFGAYYEVASS